MDHSNQEKNQDKLNYWHCLCYMVPDCSGQKESKWFGINKSHGLQDFKSCLRMILPFSSLVHMIWLALLPWK